MNDRGPEPAAPAAPAALASTAVPRQLARAESAADQADPADPAEPADRAEPADPASAPAVPAPDFDRRLVRNLLAYLITEPDVVMEYFFARLFADNPGLRGLFPYAMTQTRAAVFRMIATLIRNLDDHERTAEALSRLARDHRKFGVKEKHYRPFFAALFATTEHLAAPVWSAEMAAAWRAALDYFAAVMVAAAAEDAQAQPAWWTGEIVHHDRRTETVAVLTIRPDKTLSYEAGQYVAVQAPRWPRVWRHYSIANAPRENGLIDIHVRAVPGGMVSTALVRHCTTGDTVLLGAARGEMRVPADPARDLVCVAGGTGLAPLKAITEAVVGAVRHGKRPTITLYVGVRRGRDLYDMRDLETLRLAYPSLTVVPVAEHEFDFTGRVGRLPDVVWTHPSFRDCDVYVSGPAGLVSATVRTLSRRVPADRMHHDSLGLLQAARRQARQDTRIFAEEDLRS